MVGIIQAHQSTGENHRQQQQRLVEPRAIRRPNVLCLRIRPTAESKRYSQLLPPDDPTSTSVWCLVPSSQSPHRPQVESFIALPSPVIRTSRRPPDGKSDGDDVTEARLFQPVDLFHSGSSSPITNPTMPTNASSMTSSAIHQRSVVLIQEGDEGNLSINYAIRNEKMGFNEKVERHAPDRENRVRNVSKRAQARVWVKELAEAQTEDRYRPSSSGVPCATLFRRMFQ